MTASRHTIVTPKRARILVFALLLVWGGLDSAARAATEVGQQLSLNEKRIPIERLVQKVGEAAQRTILFDDSVRGNVSIVAKRPVSIDEAWQILESSLSMLGFSLLPSTADNWRIANVLTAIGEAPFAARSSEKDGDRSESFVTTLIPLDVANLQEVVSVLEPLSGARVLLVPFERTNSLIASGPERAIARLTTIADELDRVEERELRLRVLRYRDVAEIEPLIEALIESGTLSDRAIDVWTDARTNSVVFRGLAEESENLAEFIKRFDQPSEGEGEIRILRVLHRDPEEVAELIRSLSVDVAAGAADRNEIVATALGSALTNVDFTIAVDKTSRSLVVRAGADGHRAVRHALELLDQKPQLVVVDITVSEVRTPSTWSLGFGFQVPFSTGIDGTDLIGNIVNSPAPPGQSGLLQASNSATPLFGRLARDTGITFTGAGADGQSVTLPIEQNIVVDAGDLSAQIEVLSQPHLVVTTGDRHEIFVGQNLPIPVTADSGIATSDGVISGLSDLARTTTFERTDVGIKLGVEVSAGREGKITLDLDLDISSLASDVSLAGAVEEVGPSLEQQVVTAQARLDDGESAIIAIDREQRKSEGEYGTPFLSKIPVLGWFFKRKLVIESDTRLVVAARARRIGSPAELMADTIRRRLIFERQSARSPKLPAADGNVFAVRVTTRSRQDDADAIAAGLAQQGYEARVHRWENRGATLYDVYILSLDSMVEAAEIARSLSEDGWQADLVVLPTHS